LNCLNPIALRHNLRFSISDWEEVANFVQRWHGFLNSDFAAVNFMAVYNGILDSGQKLFCPE